LAVWLDTVILQPHQPAPPIPRKPPTV